MACSATSPMPSPSASAPRCTRNNSTPPCPGGRFVVITENFTGSSETVNGREASNEADLQMLKIGLNYRF